MINFDTDNIVLVCYPPWAGGKFLINSLGLSDDAVFQDSNLAEQQLAGNFNISDKMHYLNNAFPETNKWNDLNLGCQQLFGMHNEDYMRFPADRILNSDRFNPIIDKLSHRNSKFFLVVHYLHNLDNYLKIWKNAQVILFENCTSFVLSRIPVNPEIQISWQNLRGAYWPSTPPGTLSELSKMPLEYQLELKSNFPYLYKIMFWNEFELINYQKSVQEYKTNDRIIWDTNLYFDENATLCRIEQLYQELGLSNFKKEYIIDYYNQWINKLNELK